MEETKSRLPKPCTYSLPGGGSRVNYLLSRMPQKLRCMLRSITTLLPGMGSVSTSFPASGGQSCYVLASTEIKVLQRHLGPFLLQFQTSKSRVSLSTMSEQQPSLLLPAPDISLPVSAGGTELSSAESLFQGSTELHGFQSSLHLFCLFQLFSKNILVLK